MGGFWGILKLAFAASFVAVMAVGLWQAERVTPDRPIVPAAELVEAATPPSDFTFSTLTTLRKSDDGRTHIYISRPVLKVDRINTDLQAFVDLQLQGLTKVRSTESQTQIDGSDVETSTYELNMIFDLAFETDDYIAFSFEYGHYIDEKGWRASHTRIYEKTTGRRLKLADMFQPESNYLNEVTKHVRQDLKLQAEMRLDRFFTSRESDPTDDGQLQQQLEQIDTQSLIEETHNSEFAFTSDGTLMLSFAESLIDPSREGIVQAQVEFDALSHMLNPSIRSAVTKPAAATFETRPLEPIAVVASIEDELPGDNTPLFPDCFIQKCVALTFDDGPGHYTGRLLDTLADHEVPATFFLVGHRIKFHADDVKRMIVDGHEVGNHSWSHPRLIRLSDAQVRSQIDRTNEALLLQTGLSTDLFRPPYGEYNNRVLNQIDMPVILWNHDTLDWRVLNAQIVAQRTSNSPPSGSIILLHDIHRTTVDAMPEAITSLRDQGYVFVTVSQLFAPTTPQVRQVYERR